MAVKIQFRRDIATNWETANPVLSQGEMGLDVTNNRFKLGDGTTPWNSLPFAVDFEPDGDYVDLRARATTKEDVELGNVDNVQQAAKTDFDNHVGDGTIHFAKGDVDKTDVGLSNVTNDAQVKRTEMGVANGVATLDGNAKVPLNQLPDTTKGITTVQLSTDPRPANPLTGDKLFETDTGDTFIYDGSDWVILAEANWENVNLDWNNITNVPIASTVEAEAGTDDATVMTPLKTAQAIAKLETVVDVSQEYAAGLIETNNLDETNIWVGSETDYINLTPDENTLYFIEE